LPRRFAASSIAASSLASASADDDAWSAASASSASNSSGSGSSESARFTFSFFRRRFGGAYGSSAATISAAGTVGIGARRPTIIRTGFQRSVTAVSALAASISTTHAPKPPNHARQ
jgi:hypothetical protein